MEDLEDVELSDILDHLIVTAKADGVVTEEEEQFLETLRKDVEKYYEKLSDAKSNDIISEGDFHELVVHRDNILTDAVNFETDSEDVNKLINQLYDEINEYMIPGMVEDEKAD